MFTRYFLALLALWTFTPQTALAEEGNPPLIVLQVSEQTLNRLIDEDIERESDVNKEVLSAHVVGKAKTTGKPHVCLVECDAGPTIKAIFTGSTVSRTTGYRPPVVISSRAQTDFTVEKLIAIEQVGDVVPHSTRIRATTNTVTENITTHRRGPIGRLILRKAWRAVEASQPEADAIAQREAEKQILAAFDEALESRIEKMTKQMSLRALVAAVLPADSTPAYRSVTKGGYLTVAVFAHAPEERIVDLSLPKLPAKEQPVHIWLHKSVVTSNQSVAGTGVELAARWLAFPTLLTSTAGLGLQRGPQWITANDFFVVQLSGLGK